MWRMLRRSSALALTITLVLPLAAMRKPGEEIKPGFNMFSKEQDVQLGQQAAAEVRKQLQVVDNRELQDYVTRIGQRLASQRSAQESGFPFSFTMVNDKSINAFALPGGPTFVHSGLVQAADNEAQVAGVLAHEIAHVVLRHGTNQASKANLMQLPAMLAGAVTGSNLLAQLTQLGATGFMLKFSRSAETQADALGARMMGEAGYNPVEMARFFEKLEAEGGSRAPQFLSDHPSPGNRVKAVQEEIRALPQRPYTTSAGDFGRQKQLVAQLPAGRGRGVNALRSEGSQPPRSDQPAPTTRPSSGFKQLRGRDFVLSYPDNWGVFGDSNSASATVAPREGIIQGSNGSGAIGYGAVVSYYVPDGEQRQNLQRSTAELVQRLAGSNPNMRVTGQRRRVTIAGSEGLVTTLSSNSPFQGETERDVLVTVARPQGVFYMIFIAPERQFGNLQGTFDAMVQSIRFSN